MSRMTSAAVLIFALALATRLFSVFALIPVARDWKDAEMERAALNLACTGALANVYHDSSGPSAHVAPLYPATLAVLHRVFGTDLYHRRVVQRVLASAMAALALALLPWVAARAGLRPAAGWATALALAAIPLNVWTETTGKFEQPVVSVGILVLLGLFAALHDDRWSSRALICGTGLVLAMAALLSPALLLIGGLMLVSEVFMGRGHRARVLLGSACILMLIIAAVAPWTYRNYVTLGGFVPIRSNSGLELWVGNHPGSNGRTFDDPADMGHSSIFRLHPLSSLTEQARLAELGELAYMHEKSALARQWIVEHPGTFVRLCARRFQLFWFPPVDMWYYDSPCLTLKWTLFQLIGVGTLLGIVWLFWTRQPYRWLLLATVVGSSLPYMLTHVDLRYRYPVFALSALIACDMGMRLAQQALCRLKTPWGPNSGGWLPRPVSGPARSQESGESPD